jgi:hypothetical protein
MAASARSVDAPMRIGEIQGAVKGRVASWLAVRAFGVRYDDGQAQPE